MSELSVTSTTGYPCPYCRKQLKYKASVARHLKEGSCKVKDPDSKKDLIKFKRDQEERTLNQDALIKSVEETVKNTMKETLKHMAEEGHLVSVATQMINNQTLNNNHNLNVLCLGKNDNIFDMLSSAEGIVNALGFMKDCVLAQLAGDCRILEKAYKLDTPQAALMYKNKSKTKFVYYDERRRLTVETNIAVMAKKIAGILQRSYLKGMEGFKTDILGQMREGIDVDKMPELEPYDINLWNEHVQRLADEKYQKKILRSLKIPMAPPDE
jgi:hypothetical protein